MELQDLIAELRVNRLDDNVERYLWSDEELTGYLNDAVRQVCIRQRVLVESQNAAVCRYALAASARSFKLHPKVIAVRSLRLTEADGTTHHDHLVGRTVRWVHQRHPHWETWDNSRAHYWIPDFQQGYIYLDRGNDNAQTVDITCWRAPLEDEELDVNDPTSTPIIDELFHLDLCDWATYRAFMKKDAESLDKTLGPAAAESFEAKIGPLPSAVAIRLWGCSPATGTVPQFL